MQILDLRAAISAVKQCINYETARFVSLHPEFSLPDATGLRHQPPTPQHPQPLTTPNPTLIHPTPNPTLFKPTVEHVILHSASAFSTVSAPARPLLPFDQSRYRNDFACMLKSQLASLDIGCLLLHKLTRYSAPLSCL